MLSEKQLMHLADKLVNYSLSIGQKENPAFNKACRKHAWLRKLNGKFSLETAQRLGGKNAERALEKYCGVDFGPLVIKSGNKYCLKTKVGHSVWVRHHPDNKKLAEAIRALCWKNGANVLMTENSMKLARDRYLTSPLDSLYELPPISRALEQNVDFEIHLESRDWQGWARGISLERMIAPTEASKKAHEISDRRRTPWMLVGWPHKKRAQENKIPFSKLQKLLFACIEDSFSKRMLDTIKSYGRVFDGSKRIRIAADDGTNLSFRVAGRRFLRDDGILSAEDVKNKDVGGNIPCGEIFVAPIETSANGTLVIPIASVPGEGMAKNLILTFKNGVVVDSRADNDRDILKRFISKNSKHADRIAEFGIGCNAAAEFTGGEIIIDEKILGSIHVAIGWNLGYGGKTNASSHLDFIKDLRNCDGRVYVDKKIAIKNGKLVS